MKYLKIPTNNQLPDKLQSNDFFHGQPGEMVTLSHFVCDNPKKRQQCGCGRSLSDISTMKASTILIVADDLEDEIRAKFAQSDLVRDYAGIADAPNLYRQLVLPLTDHLQKFSVGTLVRVYQSPTSFQISPITAS